MLDNIKYLINLKSVDKLIAENNFDSALNKLNELIKKDFKPSVSYLKRGRLCKKLLMYDDAYSDFTYIIKHCEYKKEAYFERAFLNFEISNFYEVILDSNKILEWDNDNFEIKKLKFLALVFSRQEAHACEYLTQIFENNKYKMIQFLFNETAKTLAQDDYLRGLKLLEIIDIIDKDNPIKLLKEATICGFIGENEKQDNILKKIESVFPKYFVSHFRFTDMYQDKDLLEISFLLELKIFDKHGMFSYPFKILEGYKNHLEGHITDAKTCFEDAVKLNPKKPEGYVLLGQIYQLMSGYDNRDYIFKAEENYRLAESIYIKENLPQKAGDMKKQIKHLNSTLVFK